MGNNNLYDEMQINSAGVIYNLTPTCNKDVVKDESTNSSTDNNDTPLVSADQSEDDYGRASALEDSIETGNTTSKHPQRNMPEQLT